MEPVVNITSWIDVLIGVIVMLGLFGVLANFVYHYGSKHH